MFVLRLPKAVFACIEFLLRVSTEPREETFTKGVYTMHYENQHFDSRLLIYQTLAATPLQILQLALYDDLKDLGDSKYIAVALTNLGSSLLSFRAAKDIYSWVYGAENAQKGTTYMVSPFTEYLFDYTKNNWLNVHPIERNELRKAADDLLATAPKYSASYVNTNIAFYAASAILGYAVAYKNLNMSPIKSIMYGLTQPTSVVLKDAQKVQTK